MRLCLVALCAAALAGAAPARGDHLPILVIPGRADVPEFVEGVDASWGVVEGEWGLYRPGAVAPTVIPAPHVFAPERGNGYFPSTGRRPRSGRLEVEPPANRVLPPPAESYHRSWGAASDPAPATIPSDPPPVIVAPSVFYGGGGGRRPHRH
jgi:hypothetical protein